MLSDRDLTQLSLVFNELVFSAMPEAARESHLSTLSEIVAQHLDPDRADEFFKRFRARSRQLLVASRGRAGTA